MSTYYEYRNVKVMIAHKLMNMEGWKVYGYYPDTSDSMTDYYNPARWDGVAEKNGYILCVDIYGAAQQQEIKQYNYDNFTYDSNIQDKITKLKAITVDRGATKSEAETAKNMIEHLEEKLKALAENREKYIVVDVIPSHMAHPPRCNWHIEKDGKIIAKGNGILKYSAICKYYTYNNDMKDIKMFQEDKKAYAEKRIKDLIYKGYYDNEEDARKNTEYVMKNMENDIKLINSFENFINKIDTTCGGLIGEGDGTVYEKIKVTKYKDELKPVEIATGNIQEGQLFILKSNFNYGCSKGFVYRIHETEYQGNKLYHAYKLNGKYTKECTGNANRSNYWFIGDKNSTNFLKWIDKGAIAWCTLETVSTPYEIEKVVKKKVKADKNINKSKAKQTETQTKAAKIDVNNYTYIISDDIDTRTNGKIYLVKIAEKLSHEEYIQTNNYIKSLGGYYSQFKSAFLFKENPAKLFNTVNVKLITLESKPENTEVTEKSNVRHEPKYTIVEDVHTKTGATIWIVKIVNKLNRTDFIKVKKKLAAIQGYYSNLKKGFVFNYNPEEVLQNG